MECPSAERLASNEMSVEERAAWLDHAAECSRCHPIAIVMSTPATAAATTPADRIGRFVIGRVLGRGAMGTVYAAEDPELARPIAIKVLHDATAAERLRREARALARLDHPNVVRVYDVGMTDEHAFVAMELIDGENLRRWLTSAPRELPEILGVLLQAGRGLAAAHDAGIVHRDFKPDNVLVAPGRVVVGDFGLSRLGGELVERTGTSSLDVPSEDKLTVTGAVIGTPAYMAPEQTSGEATPASDQFAFCIAAWEALFGARPFAGTTLFEMRAQAAAGRVLRPVDVAVPRRLERALRRGLAARPEDRFPAMDDLLVAMTPRRAGRLVVAGIALAAIAGVVSWRVLARDKVDPCTTAGNAIFEPWTTEAKARVRSVAGDSAVAEVDHYMAEWRTARTALCHAPDSSDVSELERRTARAACYERARLELARYLHTPQHVLTQGRTIPLAACESGVALIEAPGTAADPRGCGCPYSPCVDNKCTGECNARAFRLVAPLAGIAQPGRQEAVCGATFDGAHLLYLAGQRCALDHLYLATRAGDRYESFDLTPQLAAHDVLIREGCCTLARDGRAIVVQREAGGFAWFSLDGTTLGAPDVRPMANLVTLADGELATTPVLSRDDRELYFMLLSATERGGKYRSVRASTAVPFPPAQKLLGRAQSYEYVTGLSDDGATLFMAAEFATRVLVRDTNTVEHGDLGVTIPPSSLPGWRAIPIDGCRRIVATTTPGGCESEDPVMFEAVRM